MPPLVAASLDHITISAVDLAVSASFYDAGLAAVHLLRVVDFRDEEEDDGPIEAIGYGPAKSGSDLAQARAVIWLVAAAEPTHSAHVALRANSPSQVNDFFAATLAVGGITRQRPRRWEIFRAGYYGASVADLDGNVVEVFCDE